MSITSTPFGGSADFHVMSECFRLANEALASGEVPVGCVMVYDGKSIARDRNRVNEFKNACRHAEMGCVDQVLAWCEERGLDFESVFRSISVYVTVEPCIMCGSALKELGVKRIVFGCANERFGGVGSVLNVFDDDEHDTEVVPGVWAEQAVDLLKKFYTGENPNAPCPKPKAHRKSETTVVVGS
ncbi:tRNA-specific adenosine deaminase 2 [Amblyomma americanum]